MIKLYISGHDVLTPLSEIIHAFTNEKILPVDSADEADVISIKEDSVIKTTIKLGGKTYNNELCVMQSGVRNAKQIVGDAVKLCYYKLATKIYNRQLPWGIITGIRPEKLVSDFDSAGLNREFMERFCVSDKKLALARMVNSIQSPIKKTVSEKDICVYIGIPFCPTRCLYCSFVSQPMGKQKKLVNGYVEKLIEEISYTAELIEKSDRNILSVYVGGGTPSSLDEPLFDKLLKTINNRFIKKGVDEFTVEAGRADTITEGKLVSMKNAGVTRISINPQSMNDETLKRVGRNHSEADFVSSFFLARKLGFDNINTDLIAGLPGETAEMFKNSFDKLIDLSPDGVTVHTMCIKRAANLKTQADKMVTYNAEDMVDYAFARLCGTGFVPYYMYKQKDTLLNLENVGYSLPGKESIYNIFMMEDMGTVLGLGAGSVSKIYYPEENRIERIFNFKNPDMYISRFDEILKRKDDYDL